MLEEGTEQDIPGSITVEVSGMFTPLEMLSSDQWAKYKMVGIISARTLRKL